MLFDFFLSTSISTVTRSIVVHIVRVSVGTHIGDVNTHVACSREVYHEVKSLSFVAVHGSSRSSNGGGHGGTVNGTGTKKPSELSNDVFMSCISCSTTEFLAGQKVIRAVIML